MLCPVQGEGGTLSWSQDRSSPLLPQGEPGTRDQGYSPPHGKGPGTRDKEPVSRGTPGKGSGTRDQGRIPPPPEQTHNCDRNNTLSVYPSQT